MRRLLVSAAGLLFITTGPALSAGTTDIPACSISAITNHKGPNGLNIRAGPGPDYAVIGRIPPPRADYAGEVDITGAEDGWFRIDDAWMPDYGEDNDEHVFDGEGWVSGRYLYSWIETRYLRSGPSTSKPIVIDLSRPGPDGQSGGGDSFQVEHFYDCLGNWVELEGTYFGARVRGWTFGTCASQVTTCGGGHIPHPE